ncbi:hypothetical protein A9Q84_11025 [Halobacteriovorax marinus]|uniref:Polynucleotide kinase PNKP phosphatase domain-containing protein n=1 Tax=Halobacteriovorax marinus TaxID=97084 RepID=A0A1Y5FBM7_9BACT|nr:hypothetical protein A9Q84_11025 [Halobacteriovorax marinus]
MKEIIIVDLDGTLSNCEHRVHHVESDPKDWKSFNEGMVNDELNVWCSKLISSMKSTGTDTILLTGRGEEFRRETESWLEQHGIEYLELFMRAAKDSRTDCVVKKEIYTTQISPKFKTLFVVEDRRSVVKMWRSIDLTCLQCDWGDF